MANIGKALPGSIINRQYLDALYKVGYNRNATDNEFNKFTGFNVKNAANTVLGKNSPFYTKPTSATDPIPANNLGQGNVDLNAILGANVDTGNVQNDINGLLALYGKGSESQTEYQDLQGQLTGLMGSMGQQGADLAAELEKQGVNAANAQIKELNLKLAQLSGALTTFDANALKATSELENQAIPTGLIRGQQSQLKKQNDLTRVGMAAELSANSALLQAYQGNATLGADLAQKAIDLKYQPIQANIDILKTQLGFASEKMNKDETNRSKIIDGLLTIKQNELTEQKNNEKDILNVAVEAATNGAPMDVVNSIKGSTDIASATVAAAGYAKKAAENDTSDLIHLGDSAKQAQMKAEGYNWKWLDKKNAIGQWEKPEKSSGKIVPIGAAVYAAKMGKPLDDILAMSKNAADIELVADIKAARAQGMTEEEIIADLKATDKFNHLFVGA
jgi:hypothetical protein